MSGTPTPATAPPSSWASASSPLFTESSARRLGPVRRFFDRFPAVSDVLVVLFFAGWALLTGIGADSMYGLSTHLGGQRVLQMQWASFVLTAAGALALTLRRRRPVLVAAVVGVLGVLALATTGAPSGFELGVALALYAVAASRRPAVTWATSAATVTALLVAARLLPLPATVSALVLGADPAQAGGLDAVARRARDGSFLQSVVWAQTAAPVLVLALLAIAIGTSVRNRRLDIARLLDAANALAHEQEQRLRLARAGERARIAREMHDVVAHSVSVMVALGDGASAALERAPERSRAALEDLVATGRSALGDMRRILGVLHEDDDALAPGGDPPPVGGDASASPVALHAPVEPQPGSVDLNALVDRFRRAGLPVRTTGLAADGLRDLDTSLGLAVYRIVQESLTNALRHAPGTAAVRLAVHLGPEHVEVVVTDAGTCTGVEAGTGSQRGLVGMRERAAAFGGTLEAGPHGAGWRVRAVLPRHGAAS
ncbi:histidine kinase [Paenibacillus sp. TRM 82003]|uniref:sensor histidine kinase n=1 Tax=Kineococcus sp. TRM81007 TaxID=2925831 RepID=UPI001F573913|nr:histidine kinase [Kineococcus sp. TRM81007]MCI2238359.1 histidine kinase [Kineococcus sp. TRM81007]MCI3922127.1 histidine kinase [Paenibacillus sp. TRM 82003]